MTKELYEYGKELLRQNGVQHYVDYDAWIILDDFNVPELKLTYTLVDTTTFKKVGDCNLWTFKFIFPNWVLVDKQLERRD